MKWANPQPVGLPRKCFKNTQFEEPIRFPLSSVSTWRMVRFFDGRLCPIPETQNFSLIWPTRSCFCESRHPNKSITRLTNRRQALPSNLTYSRTYVWLIISGTMPSSHWEATFILAKWRISERVGGGGAALRQPVIISRTNTLRCRTLSGLS